MPLSDVMYISNYKQMRDTNINNFGIIFVILNCMIQYHTKRLNESLFPEA